VKKQVILQNLNGLDCCDQLQVLFDSFGDKMDASVVGIPGQLNVSENSSLMYCCNNDWRAKHNKGGLAIMECILRNADRNVVLEVLGWNKVELLRLCVCGEAECIANFHPNVCVSRDMFTKETGICVEKTRKCIWIC